MKGATKNVAILTAVTVLVFSAWVFRIANAAGTASLYLSPASGSYLKGDTLVLGVYEDSGSDTVNAVQVNLTYPASSLTFVSITSSSAFGIDCQSTGGGGTVSICRASLPPPVSGAQLVATVRFSAAVGSGTASVAFAGSSSVVRSTDNKTEALTTTAGNYTLTTPAPPPPAPPPSPPPTPPPASTSSSSSSSSSSGSGSHSSSGSGSSSKPSSSGSGTTKTSSSSSSSGGAAVASKTILTISGISASNFSGGSATIKWTTSASATSEVDYGPTAQYTFSVSDGHLVTSHSMALDSRLLAPGQTYHYVVKSIDAAGNAATSPDQTFNTSGGASAPAAKSSSKTALLAGVLILLIIGAGLVSVMIRRGRKNDIDDHHFQGGSMVPTSGPQPTVIQPGQDGPVTPPSDLPTPPGTTIHPG